MCHWICWVCLCVRYAFFFGLCPHLFYCFPISLRCGRIYKNYKDYLPMIPSAIFTLVLFQEEKSCPYYMRNGSCKFGFACKFHHPEPAMGSVFHDAAPSVYGSSGAAMASQSVLPFVGGISSWPPLPQSPYVTTPNLHGLPAFLPMIISPSHNVVAAQPAWSTYAVVANLWT